MIRTNSLLLSPIINFLYAIAVAMSLTLFGFDALHSPIEVGLIYAFYHLCPRLLQSYDTDDGFSQRLY